MNTSVSQSVIRMVFTSLKQEFSEELIYVACETYPVYEELTKGFRLV